MEINSFTKHQSEIVQQRLSLQVDDTNVEVSLVRRDGSLPPILFLHGFGSTKDDYVDLIYHPRFSGRPFIAYDAPGCGETFCQDLSKVSIQFQVKTAEAVLEHLNVDQFHLQGHSMGGLTALILAHRNTSRVLSFTNIKGNLAPEDCFLSRQIISHPSSDPQVFFSTFVERTRVSPYYSSAIYAASLPYKVRPSAVHGIFSSMVDMSDNGDLMSKFLALPCPRMYMYGNQYSNLSYLEYIATNGVELAEIPYSGHFPMYSNPVEMWRRIADFVEHSEDYKEKSVQ